MTGFSNPNGIKISPDGSKAYVANIGNDTVSIVDLTTNTIIPPTITGFSQPFDIAIK
ncbi:YncE family protein [Bacillus cereus]|uniref:YncE family protein n=1 Tax=Bacillus cereus TaxID=1396 RepID=UPI001C54DAA1